MIEMIHSLYRLGKQLGYRPVADLVAKKAWFLDLASGELTCEKSITVQDLPRQRSRGSNSAKTPNRTFDTAKYVLDPDAAFWTQTQDILAEDPDALALLKKYLKKPHRLNGTTKPDEWVVLTIDGKPIAHRPSVQAWYEAICSVPDPQDTEGMCVLTGKKALIARVHDTVTGVGGGGNTKLFSVNQRCVKFHGQEQGDNFPVSREASRHYANALSMALKKAAHLTTGCSLVFWLEDEPGNHLTALIAKLLGFAKQDETKALWDELDATEAGDAKIHVALLRKRDVRIIVQAYQTFTAHDLRKNLLAFRDEFIHWRPVTLRTALPEVTDSLVFDTAWATVAGEPYPEALRLPLSKISPDTQWGRDRVSFWLDAIHYRKNPKTKATSMTTDLSTPDLILNQHIDEDLDTRMAYRFGRAVAAYCHLRLAYHKGRVANAFSRELNYAIGHPNSFIASTAKSEVYREALQRQNRKGALAFASLFEERMVALGDIPRLFNPQNQQRVILGFHHQSKGCAAYSEHRRKLYQASQKPKSAGDSGTEDEAA